MAGSKHGRAPSCVPNRRATRPFCWTQAPLVELLWTAHFVLVLLARGASAQVLIPVPATVTRELGAYYINKLSGLTAVGFEYYAYLLQRDIGSANAYLQVNNLSATDSPRDAADKISNVRGVYTAGSLGGVVTVESFYRLLRCEDTSCFTISRVVAAQSWLSAELGWTYPLTVVRSTVGNSSWIGSAVQGAVNPLLSSEGERPYTDAFYKGFTLYHKVTRPPHSPCSSAIPQLQAGSTVSEVNGVPGLTCTSFNGASMIVGTSVNTMISYMESHPLPWNQCDGSLFLLYVLASDYGPRIYRVIRSPGSVPLTVEINLPIDSQQCSSYLSINNTLQAVQAVRQYPFNTTVGTKYEILPDLAKSGFNDSCKPTFFQAYYGAFAGGFLEALLDENPSPSYLGSFLPYNTAPSEVCLSMLSTNKPFAGIRDIAEDQCAQLYFGGSSQMREGIITYENEDPGTPDRFAFLYKSGLESQCAGTRYNLSIELVLPQIAVDFEEEKNLLLSTSEVKLHLDDVAANAASVLAVEAAIATSGIIAARTIARSGLYRRRRVHSNIARASAMVTAAVIITSFNIPNFALVSHSLNNHDSKSWTQVSVHDYRPSNFSAVLRAETHSFVTVQGSRATAVIGLLLYSATMLLCLYLTWTEFTEIIHRRDAVESRLGQDALIADKDLLVQWRTADSRVYDTLHPKKVIESAQSYELEVMRRNLDHAAANPAPPTPGENPGNAAQGREANAGFTPRGAAPSPRTGVQNSPLLHPQSQPDGHFSADPKYGGLSGTPDLYPDV